MTVPPRLEEGCTFEIHEELFTGSSRPSDPRKAYPIFE
jgi:hypothetical protein